MNLDAQIWRDWEKKALCYREGVILITIPYCIVDLETFIKSVLYALLQGELFSRLSHKPTKPYFSYLSYLSYFSYIFYLYYLYYLSYLYYLYYLFYLFYITYLFYL